MAGPFYADALVVPGLVANGILLALAFFLIYINGRRPSGDPRPIRALATLLFLFGTGTVFFSLAYAAGRAGDLAAAGSIMAWTGALYLPVDFVGLYFLSVYPRPRTWLGRSHRGWLVVALASMATGALALARPELYITWDLDADGNLYPGSFGPLYLLGSFPTWTTLMLVFALDYVRAAPRKRSPSTLITSLGFGAVQLHFDAWLLTTFAFLLFPGASTVSPGPAGGLAYGLVASILQDVGGVVILGVLTGLLVRFVRRERGRAARPAILRYFAVLYLAVITGVIGAAASFFFARGYGIANNVLFPLWTILFGCLVAYALVRHRLFDLDVKVRWTIRQSTVAAVFLVVFFVVSEVAKSALSERVGTYLGIAAAALLLFALAPLQHFAERVATKAMPGVKPVADLSHPERAAFYREQARLAWSDGNLSKDERRMLDAARERLGLSLEEATRIEREASDA